jgi:hypothetical protein
MSRLLIRLTLCYQKIEYPILGAYISLIVAEMGYVKIKLKIPM